MNAQRPSPAAGPSGAPPSFRFTAGVTALAAVPAVLSALLPGLAEVLAYDRAGVAAGEWWRLFTGHWSHWSSDHLTWDLLAFVVLTPLCLRVAPRRLWATLGVSAAAISLAVHVALPELTHYRGLSGLDSALFALLSTLLLRRGVADRAWARTALFAACLLAFGIKVGYELQTGAAMFVETAGFVPVPLAHVFGGLCGGLVGLWPEAEVERGRTRRGESRRGCEAQSPRRASASSFL